MEPSSRYAAVLSSGFKYQVYRRSGSGKYQHLYPSCSFKYQQEVLSRASAEISPGSANFISKRAIHHSIGCTSHPMKSPLFRKVGTTRCSLNSCLPSSLELSMQKATTHHLIQKLSTGSARSQATGSTTKTWLGEADLNEIMLKIWRAILKRAEEKCIDWIVGYAGGAAFFAFCLFISYALGIDLRSESESSESPESKENQDALKALEAVLKHKDNRAQHYKEQAETLLKLVDSLLKMFESRGELTEELFDLLEQYKAALKQARENSEDTD